MAVHLTRALTCTEGVPGLATGLGLIHGLLERYWDRIYPLLEADHDNDPTERLNALAPLVDPDVMIGTCAMPRSSIRASTGSCRRATSRSRSAA